MSLPRGMDQPGLLFRARKFHFGVSQPILLLFQLLLEENPALRGFGQGEPIILLA